MQREQSVHSPPLLPEIDEAQAHATHADPFVQGRDLVEKLSIVQETARAVGRVLTPDRITALRIAGGAAAIGIHILSATWGSLAYVANTALDWADGIVARACPETKTRIGPSWDSLIDKAVNGGTLIYVASQINEISTWVAAVASLTVDLISQRQRGPLAAQVFEGTLATISKDLVPAPNPAEKVGLVQANTWGKIKMTMQSAAIATLLFVGQDHDVAQHAAEICLYVSAAIGSIGILKRMKS